MAVALCRLHCLLRRARVLLLCLGIAYLMAGSVLLLQRSGVRVAHPNPAGLSPPPPLSALAAPPTALRAGGLGVRARSRWAAVQHVSGGGGGAKAGRHWPASQNLGVHHLHRRWFHSLLPETPQQRASVLRSGRHKGTNTPRTLLTAQPPQIPSRFSSNAQCRAQQERNSTWEVSSVFIKPGKISLISGDEGDLVKKSEAPCKTAIVPVKSKIIKLKC